MTNKEYQKRLYIILHNMDEITTISQAINAICLLNEEAIGRDAQRVTHSLNNFEEYCNDITAKAKNEERQELKQIIGVSNE